VYYLYVLESQSDGNLYTGITSDVQRRLREHNAGRVQSTSLNGG
jgi:predicted GIY-YIG superfamily endonuclease